MLTNEMSLDSSLFSKKKPFWRYKKYNFDKSFVTGWFWTRVNRRGTVRTGQSGRHSIDRLNPRAYVMFLWRNSWRDTINSVDWRQNSYGILKTFKWSLFLNDVHWTFLYSAWWKKKKRTVLLSGDSTLKSKVLRGRVRQMARRGVLLTETVWNDYQYLFLNNKRCNALWIKIWF